MPHGLPVIYPRKRMDITWPELAALWVFALTARDTDLPTRQLQWLWRAGQRCLPVHSVRSALDLFLRACAFPQGSIALVTAVTIPDMLWLQEAHGLDVKTVDLDRMTLAPEVDELERLLVEHQGEVAFVLHAHLFGCQAALEEAITVARSHGVLFVEDCAQAFDGFDYHGHRLSDLVLWSFGPVKTATSLLGGIVVAHRERAELLHRMRSVQQADPVLPRSAYVRRLAKYTVLHLLATPAVFTLLVAVLDRFGIDRDDLLARQAHSFSSGDLLTQLRHRPHAAVLQAMAFRQSRYARRRVSRRSAAGESVLAAVPEVLRVGGAASRRTHWLTPVLHPTPDALLTMLRGCGVDASSLSTSLAVVRSPERTRRTGLAHLLAGVVYVPSYPQMPEQERARIAEILRVACDEITPERRGRNG